MGLFRWIARAFRALAGASSPTPPPPRVTTNDYLDLLRQNPGTRITTVRLLEGSAAQDGILSVREHIETEDVDGNLRRVDVYGARTCTFNHLLDQTTKAVSTCRCGALMCSAEGCSATCVICGQARCPRCRVTHRLAEGRTVTYCDDHAWRYWWSRWWGTL